MVYERGRNGIEYESIVGLKPDAIYVTSGGVIYRSERNTGMVLRSTGYDDDDPRGLLSWGEARPVAAAQIGRWYPSARIVTLTTSFNTPEGFSDAGIMAEELKMLGAENVIETLPRSIDTLSEMLVLTRHALNNGIGKMAIVMGGFQEDRAAAMLESIKSTDLEEQGKVWTALRRMVDRFPSRIDDIEYYGEAFADIIHAGDDVRLLQQEFVHAETIFPYISPYHRDVAARAIANPRYVAKAERDSIGARDWRAGNYNTIGNTNVVWGK